MLDVIYTCRRRRNINYEPIIITQALIKHAGKSLLQSTIIHIHFMLEFFDSLHCLWHL